MGRRWKTFVICPFDTRLERTQETSLQQGSPAATSTVTYHKEIQHCATNKVC